MEDRQSDPGYHLLGGGRPAFEVGIGFRPPPHTWLGRASRSIGIGGYVSAVAVVACVILALALLALAAIGLDGAWLRLLAGLGAIPAIDAAVALVNRGVAGGFGARILPALALRDGVPSHLRTLVAVPTLLTTRRVYRGAGRAAGDPSPRQPGRRPSFRTALRLGRCYDRAPRGRRRSPRRCSGGHCTAQSASRGRRRRRPLPVAPSPANLE